MNILDYVRTYFASFDESPFSVLDGLVLAQVAMVKLDGIVPELEGFSYDSFPPESPRKPAECTGRVHPADLLRAEKFEAMVGDLVSAESFRDILFWLAANPRFRDLEIWGYVDLFDPDRLMQFSAVSFSLPGKFTAVAYRGTDGTLVGWREDFSMAFMPQVAGQREARRYLEQIAALTDGPLYVTGHSKGGNLSAYATSTCSDDVRARIIRAFDLDGPGFRNATVSEEQYQAARNLIQKVVPQESVIGLLLDTHEDYAITQSDEHGIMQHNAFSWQIDFDGHGNRDSAGGTLANAPEGEAGSGENPEGSALPAEGSAGMAPDFKYVDHLTSSSELTRKIFADWMARYTDQELADFVDALFDALGSTGAQTTRELSGTFQQTVAALGEIAKNLEDPQRKILLDAITQFATTAVQATASTVSSTVTDSISSSLDSLNQLRDRITPSRENRDGRKSRENREGSSPAERGLL